MPRAIRPHAPNKGVHLTARAQGGAHFFTEAIRDEVAGFLAEAVHSCGARLLALTVMPNHFHLVIKQGGLPLGWMMQRALQRTAHLVQRVHDVEGHVFGRRFWSSVCSGPDYLRQAIVYAHLNPCAAGLCRDAGAYRWSSHTLFVSGAAVAPWQQLMAVDEARLLFANRSLDPGDIMRNYIRFVDYCVERRRRFAPGEQYLFDVPSCMSLPRAHLGDQHWADTYSHATPVERAMLETVDVRDRAIMILRQLDPSCDIDMIRTAGRVKRLCRLRRALIAALLGYQYKKAAIARCLRVSASVVSDVAKSVRSTAKPS